MEDKDDNIMENLSQANDTTQSLPTLCDEPDTVLFQTINNGINDIKMRLDIIKILDQRNTHFRIECLNLYFLISNNKIDAALQQILKMFGNIEGTEDYKELQNAWENRKIRMTKKNVYESVHGIKNCIQDVEKKLQLIESIDLRVIDELKSLFPEKDIFLWLKIQFLLTIN